MDRQTRRNFFTCVAGAVVGAVGSAGLLAEEWVPGCCPVKPFKSRLVRDCDLHMDGCQPIPLVWDEKTNEWVIAHSVENIYIGKYKYKIVRVNSDDHSVNYTYLDADGFQTGWCPMAGRELKMLVKFESSVQCNSDDMEYHNRYILINNKNEYGFLSSDKPCWNFRRYYNG